MRHNQNRRSRGRNRKGPNPLSRSYESNGPDVKVRGTAQHIADKYSALARDAISSGDIVSAENYLQHAEHYNRILMAAQAQQQQFQESRNQDDDDSDNDDPRQMNGHRQPSRGDYNDRDNDRDDDRDGGRDNERSEKRASSDASSDDDGEEKPRKPRRTRKPRATEGDDGGNEAKASQPKSDEEKPAPRRRAKAKAAEAPEGEATNDGAAALAAFPD